MTRNRNPFEFSAANDLSVDEIIDYYIEDFNYSRFIQSKRNIFLLGERGSGKTMTLLFNSLEVQRKKALRAKEGAPLNRIGVYVPCNSPLTHRTEHKLLDEFRASVLSEHVLVLSIAHALAEALHEAASDLGEHPEAEMAEELETILARPLPEADTFFERIMRLVQAENYRTSQALNLPDDHSFYDGALSFSGFVMPLFDVIVRAPALGESHFLLMLDDADYLNPHQVASLNSWIAYRDHSRFSFKVATAKVTQPSRITASGGSIIEGHDFTLIDMEKPLHNARTDFGRLSNRIIAKRLGRISSSATPEEFFPESPLVATQLAESAELAKRDAMEKYPEGTAKQISDYVYKYTRALFFRRSAKANLPVYSGFEMIVFLSTGVVRNLLEPCYWMYDKAVSLATEGGGSREPISKIDPTIQNDVIMELSERTWQQVDAGLNTQVSGCTAEQSEQIRRLFEGLAQLFRDRLHSDLSEPRATSFTISGPDTAERREVEALLTIARRALLLYTRTGTAKAAGSRETYYVPRRMLWPIRGLDPVGQHARVSLKARDLMAVARGEANPWTTDPSATAESGQGTLFGG